MAEIVLTKYGRNLGLEAEMGRKIRKWKKMVLEGLKDPKRALEYVLGMFFPSSDWGGWKKEEGVITWTETFEWGKGSPPDISAEAYHTYRLLQSVLDGQEYGKALDLGCGYGEVTPWIGEYAEEVVGIDPNQNVIGVAREHYPNYEFHVASGQNLSFADEEFGLVVTWTVLQHIPPDEVEEVASEMQRVLEEGGLILALETVRWDLTGPPTWSRSEEEYSCLFGDCTLEETVVRERPWTDSKDGLRLMVFRKDWDES